MEDQVGRACDFEKEDKKDLSGSEEDVMEPVIDKLEKKRTSAEIVEDMGGGVQNMLEKCGADMNNTLFAKRK
ncbi:hypothetical protein QTO34_007807 [Cnephaeus nilssonii]|uniref:Uncharacterized protein n=1 Tax=Cnephaeus nilssonii TaxID=3371016 RepID=A0AA40HK41_CNENI|nr:hypothetical protein QTO34_007807 [Eptesicus nilssonii]